MSEAPKETRLLGMVDGEVRFIMWTKASHVPMWGWCEADMGPEDYDFCEPECWMPLPLPPEPTP